MDFLNLTNFDKDALLKLIDSALEFKSLGDKHISNNRFQGMSAALVFEKPSLRTKITFEIACQFFGINPIFLSSSQILASGNDQTGRESIPDIGRNLERFVDLIIARVYSHDSMLELADYVNCPVINALCNKYHPTQTIADLAAIKWHKKSFDNLKVAYIGDGNNVATSLMQACALLKIDMSVASPQKYQISREELEEIDTDTITIIEDPREAVKDADVIYTDTFTSMGDESQHTERLSAFKNYQVDSELIDLAKSDVVFMHCLPAHRGEEVTDEVMDSTNSIVFDQAECKLHAAKAVIDFLMNTN